MKSFMIRKADVEDIPAIKAMAEVVFRETYREILSPEQMEYMMDMMYSEKSLKRQMMEEHHQFFICEGMGYVSFRYERRLEGERGDLFHLEKLYVMPEARGTGLGRILFYTVVEAAKASSAGATRIELNVNRNNPAVSFYEHLGMHKDREGDFPIGNGFYMNDYIMAVEYVGSQGIFVYL